MKLTDEPKVIIRHCESYEPHKIRAIVREALQELQLRPFGRTLVKPNLLAAGPQFRHAHTRPEVIEGVLRALEDVSSGMSELAVGERSGITIPTRLAFAQGGVDELLRRLPNVKRYLFEETQQVEVRYTHPGRLRDYVYIPEPVAKADFFVNAPKFKAHPWTTVTFSMKNFIGIQDDRHRLIDHDHWLNEKVVDLQYVIQPQFICIDAIVAGEGRMLTPKPFDLNLLIMGNNQVAFDAVCCQIIGVEPRTIGHIRLAEERGFGTTDLGRIQLSGNVSLEQAQERAKSFKVGLVRVEEYFKGSHITAYAGPPPEPRNSDYCWGGCPGAIEEAIEILRQFDQQCDEKMARMHVIFGAYNGPLCAKPDEQVVFIGDCVRWRGQLKGHTVDVPCTYQPRETKDPRTAKHDDIYGKLAKVLGKALVSRRKPYVRLHGCPVSVAEQLMALSTFGKVKNPVFSREEGISFNKAYLTWRLSTMGHRLIGRSYHKASPCARGQATPKLEGSSYRSHNAFDAHGNH